MLYLSYLLCCLLSTAFAGSEDEFVGIRVTYEGPKILNTTSVFSQKAMQTFDSLASNANLSFDQIIPFDSPLTVSYSGVNVTSRDQFGGDNSKYCYVEPFSSLKIKFSQPINYFGYWLTALDSNNDLHIFSNNERIFTFTPSDVEAALEGQNNYKKHPQLSLSSYSQFFVFVNFFCENCLFDQVQLYQSGSYGKYETDNHTFGYYTQSSGIVLKTSTTTAPPTQIPTTEETTTPVPTTEETTTTTESTTTTSTESTTTTSTESTTTATEPTTTTTESTTTSTEPTTTSTESTTTATEPTTTTTEATTTTAEATTTTTESTTTSTESTTTATESTTTATEPTTTSTESTTTSTESTTTSTESTTTSTESTTTSTESTTTATEPTTTTTEATTTTAEATTTTTEATTTSTESTTTSTESTTTATESTTTPADSGPSGVLIGSAFGGVAAVAAAGGLYWFMKKGVDVASIGDTVSPSSMDIHSPNEEQTETMTDNLWV